jgi:Flp pilus assembly protein TadD
MTNIHLTNLRLLCIVGLIGILCLAGCSQSANSGPGINSTMNHPEQEFQNQAHRPPTSKTLFAMADILEAQGRDSECEFVLKRIIQEYPKYVPAYNSLAELQMRPGQTNTAIETIYQAFDVNSNDPVLLNNLGVCWIVRGDYEKALESFTKAAGAMPENVRYRTNMAVALGLMARYDESLSLFKLVLPEDQAIHNLNVLKQTGKTPNPESAW